MPKNILTRQSVRIGLDGSEVVMIVNEDRFVKMPVGAALKVARSINENCDLLERGQITPRQKVIGG